jgi:hypothetical protein
VGTVVVVRGAGFGTVVVVVGAVVVVVDETVVDVVVVDEEVVVVEVVEEVSVVVVVVVVSSTAAARYTVNPASVDVQRAVSFGSGGRDGVVVVVGPGREVVDR